MRREWERQKSIVVLMSKGYTPQFDGITRYARAHNWKIVAINCLIVDQRLYHAETHKPMCLVDILATWHADGLIVDYLAAKIVYRQRDILRVPMVFPDHHLEDVGSDAVCVYGDECEIAQAAAKELFALGYTNYAFVPGFPKEPSWSRRRSDAFRDRVQRAGCVLHRFEPAHVKKKTTIAALQSWLLKLPKPCGVFCANDIVANDVRTACNRAGVRIPEDCAVLGVDNRLDICETDEPTLSSIQQDLEGCYYQASETLDRLIDGLPVHCDAPRYGVLRTVHRASTRKLISVDSRIKKALEYIRLHACERITPVDVVKEMGCGRTYADLRFRACTGHSIVTEISLRRVERIKEALARPETRMKELAEACGFASDVDMRRVFRKQTGMSPREWRKRHLGFYSVEKSSVAK